MDFELLERAWRSSANRPSEAASAYLLEDMMQTLSKRRREFRGVLIFGALMLTVQTSLISHALLVQRVLDPGREWGALLMLAVGWTTLIAVASHFRNYLRAYPDPEANMAAALEALIGENLASQRRMQLMGVAGLMFVAAMAISLVQLQQVGKMSWSNVRDFAIVFGFGFALAIAYGLWRYFRVLKPEGERLERLSSEYH
jgi:ferric-dicitrate binding protein FerR (iron transport regulator)